MHDDFTRAVDVKGSSDRSFGVVIAAFFAAVALFPVLHGSVFSIRWWAVALAASFLVLALFWSKVLRPLNRLWQRLGILISNIVGPIALAILFYGIFTPLAVLMRALGKDPLRLRRHETASYWIVRQTPGSQPGSMKDQF